MSWKIPLFKMYSDQDDIDAISSVIKRQTFWAGGPEIEQFERKIASYMGSKHAITFNSGTSALHSLLIAIDIEGKRVIVPSFTFISTVNAIVLAGGIPVFAEIENQTFGLDAQDVIKKITPDTVAILIVHVAGFPARDTPLLRKIAKEHDLLFIEDNAESMGAMIDGIKVGKLGDAGLLSFCQNKIITTGEGGAIISNSDEICEKLKLIRSHGRVETGIDYFNSTADNDYIQVGYNFRMPTMNAALGISQIKKIELMIKIRRENAEYLDHALSSIKQINVPIKIPTHFQVYQMYPILLDDQKTRDGLQNFLASMGIMTKVYFNPAHLKTLYLKRFGSRNGDLPVTEHLSERELTLPFFPGILREELDLIVKGIHTFFRM